MLGCMDPTVPIPPPWDQSQPRSKAFIPVKHRRRGALKRNPMSFMADNVSGIKIAHRAEKESADLVSGDGNLVADGLLVRIEEEEEGRKS